ncbi:MAG: LuxR C-terminal-related transcriptional regulator [Novosphingobium sp.]|uniref:response regulator transcription factor n=1 Tax=Novosphingobium sp. TaxID=1874826 RepID=UPI003C7A0F3B
MQQGHTIILVECDFRRRAAISHDLAGTGIHVEPFESVTEMTQRWPRGSVVLVADEGEEVHDLIGAMTDSGNWIPLVAYAENPSIPRVVRAVLAGALDYIDWPVGEAQVRLAIAMAEQSGAASGNVRLREAMARSRIKRLTRREREVLEGVADGLSNRLIGERLDISPRTVEIHRANMLNKMGANHTSEAIRIAIEASLVG